MKALAQAAIIIACLAFIGFGIEHGWHWGWKVFAAVLAALVIM